MNREILQQALNALTVLLDEWTPAREAQLKGTDAITALREALSAPEPEPVALESVHLTRDTKGMCVVRVNGRVAIRDNGDIIDHMATLEWFAAPPAAPAPAAPVPLTDEQIDAIRANCWSHPGLGASFNYDKFARAIERAHGITGARK